MSEFETEHAEQLQPSELVSVGGQSETLTKIEEIIRGAFKSSDHDDDDDGDDNDSATMQKQQKQPPQSDGETDANDGDTGQYISYTRFKSSGEPSLEATNVMNFAVTEFGNDDTTIETEIRQLTPDILKKTGSGSSKMSEIFKVEPTPVESPGPKPDILQNVAGNEIVEYVEDIVGNFELEVEHELGRVMSGYRLDSGVEQRADYGENVQYQMQQTIECLMSNAEKLERSMAKVRANKLRNHNHPSVI